MLDAIQEFLGATGASVTGAGAWFAYHGGAKSAFVVFGTTLSTTVFLELLCRDGTSALQVASVNAPGMTIIDLPPGSYRVNLVGGSPSAVRAGLFACPHKR